MHIDTHSHTQPYTTKYLYNVKWNYLILLYQIVHIFNIFKCKLLEISSNGIDQGMGQLSVRGDEGGSFVKWKGTKIKSSNVSMLVSIPFVIHV